MTHSHKLHSDVKMARVERTTVYAIRIHINERLYTVCTGYTYSSVDGMYFVLYPRYCASLRSAVREDRKRKTEVRSAKSRYLVEILCMYALKNRLNHQVNADCERQ